MDGRGAGRLPEGWLCGDVGDAPGSLGEADAVVEAEAVDEVVDGHAGGLHEGVDDDGADEAEPPADEVLAHRLRLGRPERDVLVVPVLAHHWPVVHVAPHVAAEGAELPGHLLDALGVLHDAPDPALGEPQLPVAADLRDVVLVHPRHRAGVEVGERLPVHVSPLEDLRPVVVDQHP